MAFLYVTVSYMAGTLSTKGLDTRPNPPYTPILLRHNNPALTNRHPSRFSTTRQVRGITAGKSQNTSIHNYFPLTSVHYTLSRCFYTCVSSSKRLLYAIHPSKLRSTSIPSFTHLCFHHPFLQSTIIYPRHVPDPSPEA